MAGSRTPGPTGDSLRPLAAGVASSPPPLPPPRGFPSFLPGPVRPDPYHLPGLGQPLLPADVTPARIELVSPAADTVFSIDATPKMPKVDIEVRVAGVAPDPTPQTVFSWTGEISFDEADVCTFGKQGVIFTEKLPPSTVTGGRFTPAFPWFRGGRLTLTVQATVNGMALSNSLKVWIFGTDPGWSAVSAELGDDTLRRIARHESGGIQFENDSGKSHQGVPKLNRLHDGGGGICQITPPSADDLWNWKTNVASGKRVFADKQTVARGFPQRQAASARFQQLVQAVNQGRTAAGLAALSVRVPPFDADQLNKDTIRGFNGYAGGMHEFRLSVVNGELQVTNVNEANKTADAVWEQVPVADRPQSGDPDYVNHVLNTAI